MTVILKPDQFNPVSRELTTGIRVNRAADTLPQTADEAIFTITGGRVLVVGLIGEVTDTIGSGTDPDLTIKFNPTATGADTELAADLDIGDDAIGTLYSLTGDFSDPVTEGVRVLESPAMVQTPFVLSEGDIEIEMNESVAGSVSWSIMYVPWDTGAEVAAA
jgi:hypothetical protein